MSITPIEMVTMAPKSQEVSFLRQGEQTRSQNQQAQHGMHFNQAIKQNSSQTVKMSETEYKQYRYDAKEKGNGQYEAKKHKKKKEEAKKTSDTGIKQGNFDIRI